MPVLLLDPLGTGKTAFFAATFVNQVETLYLNLLRGNTFQRFVSSPHLFRDGWREKV